jgi:subtilisin-like proprotein convertase family protein
MPDCYLNSIGIIKAGILFRKLLAIVLACCISSTAGAQCAIADSLPIPDNDFITLGFNVSGLTNANLASPLQGICGVKISFDHVYLGDLTITLISPAGTSVQLVGPTTNTTGYTHFTTWNIDFVPCGSMADPDAGYSSTWSNDQVWNEFITYIGTYYPANGCLEDFNVGSANGQWLIIVQDHDLLETGNLFSLTLLFCDPSGLNCSECIPNAGVLSPASFDRCLGDNILSSEISVDFGNNIPSPLHYGYEYLLVSGNTIVQHGLFFSAVLPAGNYNLCGFSYLWDDSTNINALLAAGDLSGLQQDIISGAICGKVSNFCIPIQINAPPDTVIIETDLCQGEVFSFGGQDYTTDGTFYQVHPGSGMCDSVFEIRIAPRTLSVVIDEPDTLFCNSPNVTLTASAGGASGPFSYFWTTSFGNITSSNSLPVVTVDQAGPYTVSVTDGICSGVANTSVYADQGFPQIFVEGDTLTCNQTTVNLNPIFIPSNGSVQWTGPMGFLSNQPVINVSVPGIYELTVANAIGCATSKQVTVEIDTLTSPISIFQLVLYCNVQELQLGVNSTLSIDSYFWTGPNNYTSNSSNPVIKDAGNYLLTATFVNGCQRSASYSFNGDFTIPDLMASPNDTLNCGEIITLTGTSSDPGANIFWQLPTSVFVLQPSIQVQEAGLYIAAIIGSNGCFNSKSVEIVNGPDVFPYQVYFDTLDCNHDTVFIGAISAQADEFEWLNYTGPDGDQSTIKVGSPGTYSVMITDTNSHCSLIASVFVPSNFAVPDFNYILDTINCFEPDAHLSFVPLNGTSYSNVFWELPDLTIVPGTVAISNQIGTYRLHAEGSNGCIRVKSFEIPVDTLPPYLLLEG